MMCHGLVSSGADTRVVSEQGTKMGRRSLLHVHVFGERGAVGIAIGVTWPLIASARMTL